MLSMSLPIIPFDAAAGDGVVRLCAAGSLRPALTEIIAAFQKAQGIKVEPTFGASGLLRERLASGEQGDLFASADMGQPLALQAAGKAGPVVLFARNRLCALVRPNLDVTSQTLLSAIPARRCSSLISTNMSATPGRGATRSVTSFLIWRSELGLMPETWRISNISPLCIPTSIPSRSFRI